MPKTAYERKRNTAMRQNSIETASTYRSVTPPDVEAEKLKEFYKSIPEYDDLNHLPIEEFNATLKQLRDKKRHMFQNAIEHIDAENNINNSAVNSVSVSPITSNISKSKKYSTSRRKHSGYSIKTNMLKKDYENGSSLKETSGRKASLMDLNNQFENNLKISSLKNLDDKTQDVKPKRNHSASSITWHDSKIENKDDIDAKFSDYFAGTTYDVSLAQEFDDEFKTRSMPSSPLRNISTMSPIKRRKSVTIPKPFRMTERDEDARILSNLNKFRKSFSADMLNVKQERKVFRANPVPIESRIPLYDKIMEDQAMRRAITKINSEAELRAKIKPFNFTKREDKIPVCSHALPKPKKRKFRARPVPRNLFSNYIYEKRKAEEFFRSMNRRIRAEELLRHSQLPANMAMRERSHLSTPAAHSDLPTDPSPLGRSDSSSDKQRTRSPTKNARSRRQNDFITTSPQPFRLNTAERAAKRMEDITKKIYEGSKSTPSLCANSDGQPRVFSALELRAHASGRSNLAALLRAESVKKKFEMETAKRLEEQRKKIEMRTRDRMLRAKPAWHMVKNNCEEDIAMRLQTRRDEDRLRREEYLHEMELMYGRVHEQPMLFERFYAPRRYMAADSIQLSPRKKTKHKNKNSTALDSKNVSVDEVYNGNVVDYLNWLEKQS